IVSIPRNQILVDHNINIFMYMIVINPTSLKPLDSSYGSARTNKHRILLVDDESDIVEILKRGLEAKGLQVDAYAYPQKALDSFKPNTYDLAILDIRMPVLSGFALYREIKKIDPLITVYFLSAFEIYPAEFRMVFPSMESVKTVIKKPVAINELLRQITPSLNGSARIRAAPGEHILAVFDTHQQLVEHALEFLKIGLLDKQEDVMLITDAMPLDWIRGKISKEWDVELANLERSGRVTLSTFYDWYMPDGHFRSQKNIKKLTKKIEQSLAGGRKGLRSVGDMTPFFSLDMIQEGIDFEGLWQKKFNLPLIGMCAYTTQHIEHLETAAIEMLLDHHCKVIGLP
nr:MEDS domain-containing protein [Thermoproteota archaeon]